MTVSATQLAAQLSLSRAAVSAVLSDRQSTIRVSPATRRRIVAAAAKAHYRPNAAAKAISTGRFDAVGLVMSQHHQQSTLFLEVLRGLHQVFEAQGIHMAMSFVDDQRLTDESGLPKMLGQQMVDGLLLNYTHGMPPRMEELIDRLALPAVWLVSKHKFNAVYIDDEGAGREATQKLIALGHRRIAYIDFVAGSDLHTGQPVLHYSRADRRLGYEKAMRDAGLEPLTIMPPDGAIHDEAREHARRILEVKSPMTGLVGYSEESLLPFVIAGAAKGMVVGRDLSMITFGEGISRGGPAMDFMVLPLLEIGRAAAECLLRRIASGGKPEPSLAVPMHYAVKKSLGRVSEA